jgi:hypothetical protein
MIILYFKTYNGARSCSPPECPGTKSPAERLRRFSSSFDFQLSTPLSCRTSCYKDHTLSLPFPVILPLIAFLLTCTISVLWTSGSFPYTISISLVLTLLYLEPLTLTVPSVGDSVSPLPLPYHRSLTHFLSLTFSCTTTYSLVCACFPYLYKPYILWLYSLT